MVNSPSFVLHYASFCNPTSIQCSFRNSLSGRPVVSARGRVRVGLRQVPRASSVLEGNEKRPEQLEREWAWRLPALGRALRPSEIDRSIARISLPALGALSLEPLVALTDTAFIGHLGTVSLGGVGVSNNVFNMSFTCFNFLGLATTPLIARAYGAGDLAQASRLIAIGLWVAAVVGIGAMTLLSSNALPLVRLFGASELAAAGATRYLRARILAAPFYLSSMVANGAFRGYQDTRTPLYVGVGANLVNLTLYPTLIFGMKMGVVGAGIATAAGQICAGVALLVLLVRTGRLRLPDLLLVPRLREVFPLLRTGAVLSIRTLSIFAAISYATKTAARLGAVPLAAFEIGRQIFALFARLLDAISVAAQSLVALALGQGNHRRARKISNRILQLGVTMGCSFFALLMLGGRYAPALFTRDPLVRELVARSFSVIAIVQPINGLVFCFDGIYTAGRKFGFLTSAIFSAACVSIGSLTLVRLLGLSLPSLWMALNVMMLMRALFLGLGYLSRWTPVPRRRRALRARAT